MKDVDLRHLKPHLILCGSKLLKRELNIRIIYSNHVYTEKFDANVHLKQDILKKNEKRPRVFNLERYNLSLELPQIIKNLGGKKIVQTPKNRNYVYEVILTNTLYQNYHIFFQVQKDKDHDVRLTVESAYSTDKKLPAYSPPRAIFFETLIEKTYLNKPIRFGYR